ncbi:hypothetical protein [Streptomyces cupreus]|uniref:Uncharacterized protein n=1 Tax=Streptomyces cupreus TaxID=2759956 RepID=A0A7X1MCJ3_9ACTN|nr:hypothetical protein [Streptomyces cupreus]MBC2905948.1 hypothetical protein [Streptomyces cupreus]
MDSDTQLPLSRRTVLRGTALAALTVLGARPAQAAENAPAVPENAPHPSYEAIVGLL